MPALGSSYGDYSDTAVACRISQRLKAASANAKGAESSEDDSDIEDDSAGPAVGSSDSEEEASRGIRKRKGGADAKKGPSHGASR